MRTLASALLAATLLPIALEAQGPPPVYATDKASCPAVGKHGTASNLMAYGVRTDEGLRNEAKRHVPAGPVRVLTLDDFGRLQTDVDSITGTPAAGAKTRFEPTRERLTHLPLDSATVSEGDHVALAAWLTAARDEHEESVNCEGTDGFDIHINVGPQDEHPSEFNGIVAEMIPQLPRPTGWDTATLHALRKHLVLVAGGLTYDNEHLVNGDAGHPKSRQPARFSLWEIHPITAFYICEQETCDPRKTSEWTSLEAWAKQHHP